jgi:hypothetical protein
MQIKFKAASLNEALTIVSIVEPKPLMSQAGSSVYLFYCFNNPDQENKPWCRIYSRNEQQVARAGFELDEMDEEGSFTFQVQQSQMFKSVPEDIVTIKTISAEGDSEAPSIRVTTTSGLKYDHSTYDPRRVARCDKDFAVAEEGGNIEYVVGILREALSLSQSFLPGSTKKENVDEHFNTVQIFDQSNPEWAKGNGNLFCSDGHRVFYFQSAAFQDKGLAIHASHINKVASFLGKCTGVMMFYKNKNTTFAVNGLKDQLLGWVHDVEKHTRFATYPMSRDKWIFHTPKSILIRAMDTTAIALDTKQDQRVHLIYTAADDLLRFVASESAGKFESFPFIASKLETSLNSDFDYNVDLSSFRSLIQGTKGQAVELRFAPIESGKGAYIRTVDEVTLDSNGEVFSGSTEDGNGVQYKCKVTRFMVSMA